MAPSPTERPGDYPGQERFWDDGFEPCDPPPDAILQAHGITVTDPLDRAIEVAQHEHELSEVERRVLRAEGLLRAD